MPAPDVQDIGDAAARTVPSSSAEAAVAVAATSEFSVSSMLCASQLILDSPRIGLIIIYHAVARRVACSERWGVFHPQVKQQPQGGVLNGGGGVCHV